MAKTTSEKIEVMKSYEEGKRIEFSYKGSEAWAETVEPMWDWVSKDYRVKEEPKYRPYEDTEELINDFCERSGAERSKMGEPSIWVCRKNGDFIVQITGFYHGASGDFVGIHYGNSVETLSFEELFYNYTFKDGSPCGKEIK